MGASGRSHRRVSNDDMCCTLTLQSADAVRHAGGIGNGEVNVFELDRTAGRYTNGAVQVQIEMPQGNLALNTQLAIVTITTWAGNNRPVSQLWQRRLAR